MSLAISYERWELVLLSGLRGGALGFFRGLDSICVLVLS